MRVANLECNHELECDHEAATLPRCHANLYTSPRNILKIAIAIIVATLVIRQPLYAGCEQDKVGFATNVRVTVQDVIVDGVHYDTVHYIGSVPLYFHADAPGNMNGEDWGSGTEHFVHDENQQPCVSGMSNCEGVSCHYFELQVTSGWSTELAVCNKTVTIDVSAVEAYYDYRYEGYTKTGSVSYDQNCYGFALGVGKWPEDTAYGAPQLLYLPFCYKTADLMHEATIAYNGSTHMIKVTGGFCTVGEVGGSIIATTTEKFRESAVYSQSNGCNNGVDLFKADTKMGTVGVYHLYEPN